MPTGLWQGGCLGTTSSNCHREYITLLESRMMSKLDYSAHTWCKLHAGAENSYSVTVMKYYRDLTDMVTSTQSSTHFPGDQVLTAIGCPAPCVRITIMRLRYFRRLMISASLAMFSLLKATENSKCSWLKLIQCDLQWLCTHAGTVTGLPMPDECLDI